MHIHPYFTIDFLAKLFIYCCGCNRVTMLILFSVVFYGAPPF